MGLQPVRTETLPTVIFGDGIEPDPKPLVGPHGRLLPSREFSVEELARLFELADNSPEDLLLPSVQQLGRISLSPMGCWELPTYQDQKGRGRYGRLSVHGIDNRGNLAHRTTYAVFYGVKALLHESGAYLDHLCENKACCYPRHLEPVPPRTNTMRARISHCPGQPELGLS